MYTMYAFYRFSNLVRSQAIDFLEIRYPAVVAPVTLTTPSQRLVLGSTDLSRLGVRIALELWRGATEHALVDVVWLGSGGGSGLVTELRCGGRGSGASGCRRRGSGIGLEGSGHGGGALKALELGLLVGGELGGRGAGAEGGGEAGGG